jgi:hypothetical protein
MRRRKLLCAMVTLAVLVAVGVVALWPQPERITRENFNCVQTGMSRADVEAILGPPGDYRTMLTEEPLEETLRSVRKHPTPEEIAEVFALLQSDVKHEIWMGDRGDIRVSIGPRGIIESQFTATEKVEQSVRDNFLWRIKRQWRKWSPE